MNCWSWLRPREQFCSAFRFLPIRRRRKRRSRRSSSSQTNGRSSASPGWRSHPMARAFTWRTSMGTSRFHRRQRSHSLSTLFAALPPANAPRRAAEIPTGIAVSPDGKRLYVALNLSNRLAELDAATGEVLRCGTRELTLWRGARRPQSLCEQLGRPAARRGEPGRPGRPGHARAGRRARHRQRGLGLGHRLEPRAETRSRDSAVRIRSLDRPPRLCAGAFAEPALAGRGQCR